MNMYLNKKIYEYYHEENQIPQYLDHENSNLLQLCAAVLVTNTYITIFITTNKLESTAQ